MNKHTPRPWGFDPPDDDAPPVIWAFGIRIARLSAMSPEEMLANARLIAAAPELLAALKSAYALMPLGAAKRAEWMTRAGEVITKAEDMA